MQCVYGYAIRVRALLQVRACDPSACFFERSCRHHGTGGVGWKCRGRSSLPTAHSQIHVKENMRTCTVHMIDVWAVRMTTGSQLVVYIASTPLGVEAIASLTFLTHLSHRRATGESRSSADAGAIICMFTLSMLHCDCMACPPCTVEQDRNAIAMQAMLVAGL